VTRPRPASPFVIAAGAAALVLATSLVDFALDGGRVRIFDAEAQWSWSHLLATAAFAGGALMAVRNARAGGARRRAWQAIGVLFGLLLLDNVTRFHTHIGFWPALYAPILVGLSAAIWSLARDTREATVIAAGLLALFVSVSFHVAGPYVMHALGRSAGSWPYQIKASLKESTELAGWILVVPGLWRLHRGRQAAVGRFASMR
jgi:hypothetical protein